MFICSVTASSEPEHGPQAGPVEVEEHLVAGDPELGPSTPHVHSPPRIINNNMNIIIKIIRNDPITLQTMR